MYVKMKRMTVQILDGWSVLDVTLTFASPLVLLPLACVSGTK